MIAAEVRIGTRGSALALAQARLVAEALERAGRPARLVVIETEGDRRAADTAWGEGAFVAAIERDLLAGQVDVAVHSAKDVPTAEHPQLVLAAYLERADPRDALVVREGDPGNLADLPPGSRVGTDSPRRGGFILAQRPDLAVHPLHGNVDTRLRRLEQGETDCLVLAAAGLDRLGAGRRIAVRLDPEVVPPAPGQGALVVQARRDDDATLSALADLDHAPTRRAVEAERAFLAAAGGGCRAPIGALAVAHGEELELLGGIVAPDGSGAVVGRRRGPADAAADLATSLLEELGERAGPAARRDLAGNPPTAIVTRAAGQADELEAALRRAGMEPLLVPAIEVALDPAGGPLDAALSRPEGHAWVVVTSSNGAQALVAAADRLGLDPGQVRVAAIGEATEEALESAGLRVEHRPARATAAALGESLPLRPGDRVLVVRGDLASRELARTLGARGAAVDDVVAYRTSLAPIASQPLLRAALDRMPRVVILTSGSTARGLLALASETGLDVRRIPAVCLGPETEREALAAGFRVAAVAEHPTTEALAIAAAGAADTERVPA